MQEDERGLDSGFGASLRPQPDGEVVMLSSTLSEDEDLDMDSTNYSHYASTGAAFTVPIRECTLSAFLYSHLTPVIIWIGK